MDIGSSGLYSFKWGNPSVKSEIHIELYVFRRYYETLSVLEREIGYSTIDRISIDLLLALGIRVD